MIFTLVFSVFLVAPPPKVEAVESIRSADLRGHVYFLASEELQGRGSGSEGERFAAAYLATRLRSYGLLPLQADGSYYQDFEFKEKKFRNVLAWKEGSDPELKNQYVVIGAHYDHLGWGDSGNGFHEGRTIHNGADDNASGTAAVLELAQAFQMDPPRRSVVFILFSGEELGLLGSEHYCKQPPRPLENTVAMLNVDMVGRSQQNYLFVGGTGTGKDLDRLVEEEGRQAGLQLETHPSGRAPSDNASFNKKKVPVLFFFSHIHEDYHGPGDDWWKLDYGALEKITKMIFGIAHVLSNEPQKREFAHVEGMSLPKDFSQRMKHFFGEAIKKRQEARRKEREAKSPKKEEGADGN